MEDRACSFHFSRLFPGIFKFERKQTIRVNEKVSFAISFLFYSKDCTEFVSKICPFIRGHGADKFHRMEPRSKKNDTIFFNSIKGKWRRSERGV